MWIDNGGVVPSRVPILIHSISVGLIMGRSSLWPSMYIPVLPSVQVAQVYTLNMIRSRTPTGLDRAKNWDMR